MTEQIKNEHDKEELTCVLFTLHDSLYGVDAMVVRHIIRLPALTFIKGMVSWVVGVFDLGGRIIPVVDLDLRFGHLPNPCSLTDNVIVIETEGRLCGFIANHTLDVRLVSGMRMEEGYGEDGLQQEQDMVLQGEVEDNGDIIMLLNHSRILPPLRGVTLQDEYLEEELIQQPCFRSRVNPEEMTILQERAKALKKIGLEESEANQKGFAVVELGDEFFAVELTTIREFANITDAAPIPCTPPNIVGNMNLRGDIVTLIDIRAALTMRMSRFDGAGKIVVAHRDDLLVGVVVQRVLDVFFAAEAEIKQVPMAVKGRSTECIKGGIHYDGKIVTVLDITELLSNQDLLVDEEVK